MSDVQIVRLDGVNYALTVIDYNCVGIMMQMLKLKERWIECATSAFSGKTPVSMKTFNMSTLFVSLIYFHLASYLYQCVDLSNTSSMMFIA